MTDFVLTYRGFKVPEGTVRDLLADNDLFPELAGFMDGVDGVLDAEEAFAKALDLQIEAQGALIKVRQQASQALDELQRQEPLVVNLGDPEPDRSKRFEDSSGDVWDYGVHSEYTDSVGWGYNAYNHAWGSRLINNYLPWTEVV